VWQSLLWSVLPLTALLLLLLLLKQEINFWFFNVSAIAPSSAIAFYTP